MDARQQKTLRSLLKITANPRPQDHLEELRGAITAHHGLYLQEGDREGAALMKPILDAVMRATSVKELEQMVSTSAAQTPSPPSKQPP